MLLSELTVKDIINDHDGAKIGKITDLEVDTLTGKILNVKIQGGFKISSLFSSKNATSIPWNKLIKIGSDVIIIDNDHRVEKE